MQSAASWQLLKKGKMSLFVVFWGFCFCICFCVCFFPPGVSFLPQGGAEQGVAGSRARIRQLMARRGESSAEPRVNLERGRILPPVFGRKNPKFTVAASQTPASRLPPRFAATPLSHHSPVFASSPCFIHGVSRSSLAPGSSGTGPLLPGELHVKPPWLSEERFLQHTPRSHMGLEPARPKGRSCSPGWLCQAASR